MTIENFIREGQTVEFKKAFEEMLREACSSEVEKLRESMIKRVNRVRQGEVQRNKAVVADPNYKMSGGKIVRQTAEEKRNRKVSQRQAAIKRQSKLSQALRNRKVSLRKREAAGFNQK